MKSRKVLSTLAVAVVLLSMRPVSNAYEDEKPSLVQPQREWVEALSGIDDDLKFLEVFEEGMQRMFHTCAFVFTKGAQQDLTQTVRMTYGNELCLIREKNDEYQEFDLGSSNVLQVITADDGINPTQRLTFDDNAVVVLGSKRNLIVVDFRNELMHWTVVDEPDANE